MLREQAVAKFMMILLPMYLGICYCGVDMADLIDLKTEFAASSILDVIFVNGAAYLIASVQMAPTDSAKKRN